ncbi:MAG: GNAT family N-acetyltransferase [Oscillospiraceae bacterium]|nr:GNAT family N-acetyltransferase [Oscillospiraceae bacterium]
METKRLILRSFSPDDGEGLFEYLSQEETVKFEPYGVFTREQAEKEAVTRAEDPAFWAVCLKDTGKLIGNLYLAEQDFGTWELGYVFHSGYRGKGYATEAAKALIDDLFAQGRGRRVIALCDPLNPDSWRLLERLGMRREGHLLKNIWFDRDDAGRPVWKDTYEYAVLKEEWKTGR